MNKKIIRYFVISFYLLALSACGAEKCIVVVNKDGVLEAGVSLVFSSLIELNTDSSSIPVTTFNPFYTKNLGVSDNQGRICFKQHVYKDSSYLYQNDRRWVFSKKNLESVYVSFEVIPNKLVLTVASESNIDDDLKDVIQSIGQ